jgi:hypothetical protein
MVRPVVFRVILSGSFSLPLATQPHQECAVSCSQPAARRPRALLAEGHPDTAQRLRKPFRADGDVIASVEDGDAPWTRQSGSHRMSPTWPCRVSTASRRSLCSGAKPERTHRVRHGAFRLDAGGGGTGRRSTRAHPERYGRCGTGPRQFGRHSAVTSKSAASSMGSPVSAPGQNNTDTD